MPRSAYHRAVRDRLTKAQVERLLEAVDGPPDDLVAALTTAIQSLRGDGSLDTHLRAVGRDAMARAIAGGDADAAVALALELNELRSLS